MNGAQALVETAIKAGVEVCFCNPGTTELPLVAAFEEKRQLKTIGCLFEGVATGAADGYGRMAGKPALTLTHQGPGFANGIANLHNAKRARSPVVNLVGDQPSWHRPFDPPLTCDIEQLARPVSGWVRRSASAETLSRDFAEAVGAALEPPGCPSTLIIPADCQWSLASRIAEPVAPRRKATPVEEEAVERIARILLGGDDALVLLGGSGLLERGLKAAQSLGTATGCRLMCESFPAKLSYGQGLPKLERVPYLPEVATEIFRDVRLVVLAGMNEPVSFFGYRDGISRLLPDGARVEILARPTDDVAVALEALAEMAGAPILSRPAAAPSPPLPSGALSPPRLLEALAALLPENSIVVDEGISVAGSYLAVAHRSKPHTYLSLTGGACGMGLPCAVGAATASPSSKIVALEGDGSAMFTLQALWTQASQGLDILNLICANRGYQILRAEFVHQNDRPPGAGAEALFDLGKPTIDWVAISRGMGVPAARVEDTDRLIAELGAAFEEPGPRLIEIAL